jgi:hypothetical protein
MTTISDIASCKRRRIVSVLLPVLLVIFWSAPLVAARSQESIPARPALTGYRHVTSKPSDRKERSPLALRSLSHPFPSVPQKDEFRVIPYDPRFGFVQPSYPVAAGGKAVWYSAGVNQIHGSLLLPGVTWLGTDFGLKRLDNRLKTVRHFCALDGLPYNKITALAGQEQQLYCSAEEITDDARRIPDETRPHHTIVALCRYHAYTGKWETVASETRNYPQGVHVSFPEQSKAKSKYPTYDSERAERQYVAVGGGHACLVMGPGMPGQGLALISPIKGGDTANVLCPSFAKEPFHISFAHADADSLWIGSDLGLLRYDFNTQRWERLLSDLVVTGGCPADQGGLWLLTQRFDPVHQDRDGYNVQTGRWQITHFVMGKNPEYFALLDHENQERLSGDTISFANIVAAGDRVWTTEQRFLMWGNMEMAYLPAVYSLDLRTRQVAPAVPSGAGEQQYASVPDALLANALTGMHALAPLAMPTRFPGWICPPDENTRLRPEMASQYTVAGADDADGHWYTQGESGSGGPDGNYSHQVLKHVGSRGEDRESYTFPAFTVETHEPVSSPVVLGEKVYFLSDLASLRLYAWDRKTDRIVPVPEMDAALTRYKPDWGETCRLMSDGTSLWVGTGHAVLRYNLKTKQTAVWSGDRTLAGSWAYPYPLLSVEAGKAWIKGAPNRLLIAGNPAFAQMVPVAQPPFPVDVEQDPAEATLFAMEDGIVWFQTKSAAIPRHPVLIGYRTQSRTWTSPYAATLSLMSAADTAHIVRQGPIQWFYGSSCALGFNTATGQWQTLPPIPVQMQAYSPSLTSVDTENAWVLSESKLFHLDRTRNTWISEEVPFHVVPFQTLPAVRDGSALLVPTQLGLWTIDLTTKKVTQAPAMRSSGAMTNSHVVAIDHNAVWVVGGRAGEGFLFRFDREARTWNLIPAQEGVSMNQYNGAQWRADGVSCWLNTPKDTYRLDIKTNRWENVSARLAGKQNRLAFQQVVPDGEDVWLVAATMDERNAPLPHPPAIPLYRYNIKTNTFVPVQPSSGTSILPRLLTVNKDSVLLASTEGNFRFDRATNRWKTVSPPALPIGLPPLETLAIYEEPGSYWFAGANSSLHLKK